MLDLVLFQETSELLPNKLPAIVTDDGSGGAKTQHDLFFKGPSHGCTGGFAEGLQLHPFGKPVLHEEQPGISSVRAGFGAH